MNDLIFEQINIRYGEFRKVWNTRYCRVYNAKYNSIFWRIRKSPSKQIYTNVDINHLLLTP